MQVNASWIFLKEEITLTIPNPESYDTLTLKCFKSAFKILDQFVNEAFPQ